MWAISGQGCISPPLGFCLCVYDCVFLVSGLCLPHLYSVLFGRRLLPTTLSNLLPTITTEEFISYSQFQSQDNNNL